MFVSIDHLCPKETILSFAQWLSKFFVDPFKLIPELFHVGYYEKMYVKVIFSLESLTFFQKFVFAAISSVLQKRSYNFHSKC